MAMRILFACGGTAGHINPALAVADTIRQQYRDAEILFAGNPENMEAKLVPKAGFAFAPIHIQGFQRKINLRNVVYNTKSVWYLMWATNKARSIIRDFGPQVVMGTGGYVSGPVLRAAAKMGIPTITHEQNAFPGVTTKVLTRYVDKVLLAVEEAKNHLPKEKQYVVTGNPIRQEILFANREQARQALGVGDRICLLSFGGSLGAQRVNQAVAQVMAHFQNSGRIHHIHATGQYGTQAFPKQLDSLQVSYHNNPHMDIRTYIDDMPSCLAAADLVICRAGAISLSELQAAGRASILIPSPNVAENHQYHNAMVLANKGAAVVIEEKELTGPRLCQEIARLVENPQQLAEIGKHAGAMAIVDANQRICKELYSLMRP